MLSLCKRNPKLKKTNLKNLTVESAFRTRSKYK